MASDDLFSQYLTREQLLAGGPLNRRAHAILFEINSLSARLSAQSRQAAERYLSEETAQERDLAFIEAYNLGRAPPRAATIQDIERYAERWSALVPARAALRATVAHLLGAKYQFSAGTVPGIWAALGLDGEAAQAAYRRFYDQPVGSIYATHARTADRLRWAWHRLGKRIDQLSPFWLVFYLIITEMVGAGILALPIALASIGALPGIAFLVLFGLINVLTVAYMAETATRDSIVRYGHSFMGRTVAKYLGNGGSLVVTAAVLVKTALTIIALYLGFSATLTAATGVPPVVWIFVLFASSVYVVSRGSLNATVTLALVVGTVSFCLLTILALLAAPYVRLENLTYVGLPFARRRPFDASFLALVFGVILAVSFGHFSVFTSADTVLRRDPGGGALVKGAMAAHMVVIVIYSLWIVVVNGAIAPAELASETGTALIPLAATVGPSVSVIGAIFVILLFGINTTHQSLALFNLTRERLPQRMGRTVTLPRRQARLRLYPAGAPGALPQVNLVYLGRDGDLARFRLDIATDAGTQHIEAPIKGERDAEQLIARYLETVAPSRRPRLRIVLQAADGQLARLRISSSFAWVYETGWDPLGLSMSDVLALPEEQGKLITWILRYGPVDLAQVAGYLDEEPEETRAALSPLVEQGFVQQLPANASWQYTVRLAAARPRRISGELAQAAAGTPVATTAGGRSRRGAELGQRALDMLLDERGRRYLAAIPIVVVFLLSVVLLLAGQITFTGPFAVVGVIVATLLGSIFPVLLLRAGRRRGDLVPAVVYHRLGHTVLLAGIFLFSLTGVILHGLLIWQDLVLQALALLVAVAIIVVTIGAWRRGAFARRLVVQLRQDQSQGEAAEFTVKSAGRPTPVAVELDYAEGEQHMQAAAGRIASLASLRRAVFRFGASSDRELEVWVYRVTRDGRAEALPATLALTRSGQTERFDLQVVAGQLVQPLDGEACHLEITFPQASEAPLS